MKKLKILVLSLLLGVFYVNSALLAADVDCDVCGMKIEQKGRNHILLKNEVATQKTLHVCSIPCLQKARKHDSKYTKMEMVDFNNSEKWISGEKAFFLIKSKKIKVALGEMVMPPYIGAFATKKEANTALQKYNDGTLVQGFENALKTLE